MTSSQTLDPTSATREAMETMQGNQNRGLQKTKANFIFLVILFSLVESCGRDRQANERWS